MVPGQSETPNPTCSGIFIILVPSAALRRLSGISQDLTSLHAGVKGGEANLEKTQDLFFCRMCRAREREGTADSYLDFTTSGSPTVLTRPCCFRC